MKFMVRGGGGCKKSLKTKRGWKREGKEGEWKGKEKEVLREKIELESKKLKKDNFVPRFWENYQLWHKKRWQKCRWNNRHP